MFPTWKKAIQFFFHFQKGIAKPTKSYKKLQKVTKSYKKKSKRLVWRHLS